MMSGARKLELVCGVATGLLGVIVTLLTLYLTQETARRLKEDAPLVQTLLVWALLYILPSLLVSVGAYVHALKREPWGRIILLIGAFLLALSFSLLLFGHAFYRTDLWLVMNLSLPLVALLTLITSLAVREKS